MSAKRIRHTAKFKFTIGLEAIKSDKTINQLASEHQLLSIAHDRLVADVVKYDPQQVQEIDLSQCLKSQI